MSTDTDNTTDDTDDTEFYGRFQAGTSEGEQGLRSRSEISAEELMRLPVDNRSMIPFISRSFLFNELAVIIAAEFELITDILESPLKVSLGKKSLFNKLINPFA